MILLKYGFKLNNYNNMGFFSNLKNKITGGGAKVSLEVETPKFNSPFKVTISALVSNADIEIQKVYVAVKSVEKATVRNVEVLGFDGVSKERKDVFGEETIYPRTEFVISGPQSLKANESYTWSKEISISGMGMPTYRGKNAQHEWMLLAGLDAPGNDPDSGWSSIDMF